MSRRKFLPPLLVSLLALSVHAQFTCVTNNGSITIAGYTGLGGDVIIPATINGRPVTRIGQHAFQSTINLTNIILPNTIGSIDPGAFSFCTQLKAVNIPSSVTTLGDSAFAYCNNLAEVTLSTSLTNIFSWTFASCENLTSVFIPGNVAAIGERAFDSCAALTNVTFHDRLVTIGDWAFAYSLDVIGKGLPRAVGYGRLEFDRVGPSGDR